jgi:phage baseplate assembly protein W
MAGSSDYNVSEQRVVRIAQPSIYADLPLAFQIHPVMNDIRPITDIAAIKQSVKNLVLTNYFDRPFHPEIGGNITALLFENADIYTANAIQTEIERVLDRFEPRIANVSVEVIDDSDRNAYTVSVGFTVRSDYTRRDVEFQLYRQR